MELKLTRYNGGGKGPLVVWHGLGVSSDFAILDTIDVNLVEFFVSRNYDVWNVDWRASPAMPAASTLQYNIDDAANYDVPAVVDKVLEVTGQVLKIVNSFFLRNNKSYTFLLLGRFGLF